MSHRFPKTNLRKTKVQNRRRALTINFILSFDLYALSNPLLLKSHKFNKTIFARRFFLVGGLFHSSFHIRFLSFTMYNLTREHSRKVYHSTVSRAPDIQPAIQLRESRFASSQGRTCLEVFYHLAPTCFLARRELKQSE